MNKIKCGCGGAYEMVMLKDFDFGPFAGFPLVLSRVPGLRCNKCGEETMPGTVINLGLNIIAFEIVRLESLLNADHAIYLRKRLGLTQKELAERLAVNRVTVAEWERGEGISKHHDHALRGLMVRHLIASGVLKDSGDEVQWMDQVRTDPPRKRSGLPPAAIADMLERMKKGTPRRVLDGVQG